MRIKVPTFLRTLPKGFSKTKVEFRESRIGGKMERNNNMVSQRQSPYEGKPDRKLLEKLYKNLQEVDELETLRRIDVLVESRRRALLKEGKKPLIAKSVTINTSRNHDYVAETFWKPPKEGATKGKSEMKLMGNTPPEGYDWTMVVISEKFKEKFGDPLKELLKEALD